MQPSCISRRMGCASTHSGGTSVAGCFPQPVTTFFHLPCWADLGQVLFDVVFEIVAAWSLDTQEVEGVNSGLKYVSNFSPNISFPLMSSRVTAKKAINACGTRGGRQVLLDECEYYYRLGTLDPRMAFLEGRYMKIGWPGVRWALMGPARKLEVRMGRLLGASLPSRRSSALGPHYIGRATSGRPPSKLVTPLGIPLVFSFYGRRGGGWSLV